MRELDVVRGRYRSVVTYLEMRSPPRLEPRRQAMPETRIVHWQRPSLEDYLALFRRVGDRWLWHGRLELTPDEIERVIQAPATEIFRLEADGDAVGFCELDRSRPSEVEIGYFGVIPECLGQGLGEHLMREVLARVWTADELGRLWLHTCTEDDPRALSFYRRMGFVPYREETVWVHDPRLRGLLPRSAGPHVPIPE